MHKISVEKVIVYTSEVSFDENGYHHIWNCCNGHDCFKYYKNKWVIFSPVTDFIGIRVLIDVTVYTLFLNFSIFINVWK